ncbi:MAG: pilus assembly protein N-terminal domain-containing protein [Archangium sp.]|nr:pilus assembly protein N-terminal domain-containing protein [Archangium sp.]
MLVLTLALMTAQVPTSLTLGIGEHRTIKLGPIQRIAVSASVYEVRTFDDGVAEFIARSEGASTFIAWRPNGERIVFPIRVVIAARGSTAPSPKGKRIETQTLTLPDDVAEILEVTETNGEVHAKAKMRDGTTQQFVLKPRAQ